MAPAWSNTPSVTSRFAPPPPLGDLQKSPVSDVSGEDGHRFAASQQRIRRPRAAPGATAAALGERGSVASDRQRRQKFVQTLKTTLERDGEWNAAVLPNPLKIQEFEREADEIFAKSPYSYIAEEISADEGGHPPSPPKKFAWSPAANELTEAFYWLCKCQSGNSLAISEKTALRYVRLLHVSSLNLSVSNELLVGKILRCFNLVLNKKKREIGDPFQTEIERCAAEVFEYLGKHIVKRKTRYGLAEHSVVLSSFAHRIAHAPPDPHFLPRERESGRASDSCPTRQKFRPLFDAVADQLVVLANDPARLKNMVHRNEFLTCAPYVLNAFALAQIVHKPLLQKYLELFAKNVSDLTFSRLAVIAHALRILSTAGGYTGDCGCLVRMWVAIANVITQRAEDPGGGIVVDLFGEIRRAAMLFRVTISPAIFSIV